MLDHVIPLNEYHLRRLGRAYIAYYHAIALTFTEHAKRDSEGLGHWIGQLEARTHRNVLVVDLTGRDV
jgi:hypothetical protein